MSGTLKITLATVNQSYPLSFESYIFFTFFDKKIQYIRTNKTFESQINS